MAEFFGFDIPDWAIQAGGAAAGGYLSSQGTPDQKTTQSPYMFQGQQEGITNFLNASKQKYAQGPQQYFPGSTVAGLDPNVIAGQNQQLGTVNQQSGLANQLVQGVQGQLQGTDKVGGFQLEDQVGFGIDQGLQDAVTNPIMRNLQEKMLPGLDLQSTSQGAFGGSRAQQMKGQAVSDATGQMSDSIARANLEARQQSIGQRAGDTSAQLAGRSQDIGQNQYSNTSQQWGLNAIPGAMSALQRPGQTMGDVGAVRTNYEQQLINADKARFDFNQVAPETAIDDLGRRMNLTPGGYQTNVQGQDASLMNILGGAWGGYQDARAATQPAGGNPAVNPATGTSGVGTLDWVTPNYGPRGY